MGEKRENTILNLLIPSDIRDIAKVCKCGENMVHKVLRGVRSNKKILETALAISKTRFRLIADSLKAEGLISPEVHSVLFPKTIPFTKEQAEKLIEEGGIEHLLTQVSIRQSEDIKDMSKKLKQSHVKG